MFDIYEHVRLDKFQSFVQQKFDIAVKWSTKKIRSLFCLEDKSPHPDCKTYEGTNNDYWVDHT